jgi:hypothetical protein
MDLLKSSFVEHRGETQFIEGLVDRGFENQVTSFDFFLNRKRCWDILTHGSSLYVGNFSNEDDFQVCCVLRGCKSPKVLFMINLPNNSSQSDIIIYQTEDGQTRIQVRVEDETFWLIQKLMADLFQRDVRAINTRTLIGGKKHERKTLFTENQTA